MPWIDIVLIAIIVIYAIIGLSKGFLKSLLRFLNTLVVLVLSIFLGKYLAMGLESLFGLGSVLGANLEGALAPMCVSSGGGALDNVMLNNFAEILLGPEYWLMYGAQGVMSEEFIADFAGAVGHILAVAISIVIVYVILKLIFKLLSRFLKFLTEDRVIGWVERVFGSVIGIVEGALVIWLGFCVMYLVLPAIPMLAEQSTILFQLNGITAELFLIVSDFMEGIVIPFVIG